MNEMNMEVETITPDLAKEYLMTNIAKNRNIVQKRVQFYSKQMKDGNWHQTPQGIVFDVHGRMIDGQHRLRAIIDANMSIPMTVVRNAPEEAFRILDSGMGRTLSFRSGVPSTNAAIATALIKVSTSNSASVISVDELHKYYNFFKTEIDKLAGSTKLPKISVAPVQAAVVLHLVEGNEYALEQYRAMVNMDVVNIQPCTAAIMRRLLDSASINGSASERNEIFVRTYRSLTKKNAQKRGVVIKDLSDEINKIRTHVQDLMSDE